MCGLTGIALANEAALAVFDKMTDRLIYRGPDSRGVWMDAEAGVALGHRRLSILELSLEGHQPMVSACGRYVMVFNGEIYNHSLLRKQIEHEYHVRFRGHSDTEVLLAMIAHLGFEQALQATVGMFAIALWDKETRTLSLARDRMGEKPMYYGKVNGVFAFASELKAFGVLPGFNKNNINLTALSHYLAHNYVPAPLSIFNDIYKLEPGNYLNLLPSGEIEHKTYWSWQKAASAPKLNVGFPKAADLLEQRIRESVALQMEADVEVGAFLSGGVDSSTVVALMQAQAKRPVETFSIGFEEKGYNEAEFAKAVSVHLKTDHHELYVTGQDCLNVVPKLPQMFDEPMGDSSQVPTYLVSKLAKGQVTVSLSGDGGDELFGGYRRYRLANLRWNTYRLLPELLRKGLGHLMSRPLPNLDNLNKEGMAYFKRYRTVQFLKQSPNREAFYQNFLSIEPDVSLWLKKPFEHFDWQHYALPHLSFKEWMMACDQRTSMAEGILSKVDRAAMSVSLETRAPLLDHRVVELAYQLPLCYKMQQRQEKRILKEVLYRYVPRELVERRKMGFSVPLRQWLTGPLKDWTEHLLDPKRLQESGIWNVDTVTLHWQAHQLGLRDFSQVLWNVMMFEAWKENY